MVTISEEPLKPGYIHCGNIGPGCNLISFLEVKYFWKKFSTVVASNIYFALSKKSVSFAHEIE